ncbi:PH domain-containing protein [Georgenia sp. TF02-10]|nr:PH domain-containing protein [Georgenia sp. TF02-10]
MLAGLAVVAVWTGSSATLFGALPALVGWGGYLWGRFAGEFNFRSALSPDGIRLRHGLLETRTQTVPPGRVQAVSLTQPLLWRRKGWWRVQMNVAGYGSETATGNAPVETVLLPVGDRGAALTSLWLVVPDLGVEDVPAVLDAALVGDGDDAGFLTSPASARWLDPFTWRRLGVRITGTAMLLRSGRLTRSLIVVPHERTQSLALTQGPLERRFGLANLFAHSVPGPVTPVVYHLAAPAARDLLLEQAARARTARAAEGPEEWMRRVAPAVAEEGEDAGEAELLDGGDGSRMPDGPGAGGSGASDNAGAPDGSREPAGFGVPDHPREPNEPRVPGGPAPQSPRVPDGPAAER